MKSIEEKLHRAIEELEVTKETETSIYLELSEARFLLEAYEELQKQVFGRKKKPELEDIKTREPYSGKKMNEPTNDLKVKNIHLNIFTKEGYIVFEDEKGFTKYIDLSKKQFLKFLNKHIKELEELTK